MAQKVYGPYLRKDGRKHVVIYGDGVRRTVSYPKWLLEQQLGRELVGDETCDHVDENFTNDDLRNLQVLSRADNIKKSLDYAEMYTFNCPWCGTQASRRMSQVRANWKTGKEGPFCSRSCAAKATYVNHWQ